MDGLAKLQSGWQPNVFDVAVWRDIVADALRLAEDGWATAAMALGWSSLDLWGHSDRRDGLAVWMRSRSLVLLDERTAIVEQGATSHQFNRCRDGMPGAKLLWEIDRWRH